MILRSFPMIDFSPVEDALKDACALLMLVGRVVRGSSVFGSAGGLRVNMKSPDEIAGEDRRRVPPHTTFLAPRLLWSQQFRCRERSAYGNPFDHGTRFNLIES